MVFTSLKNVFFCFTIFKILNIFFIDFIETGKGGRERNIPYFAFPIAVNESSLCSTFLLVFGDVIILDFSPFYVVKSLMLVSGVSYGAVLTLSTICHKE